ncbi:peptidase C14 [Cylindrobasidium torrendii FP15055 ss-10]|uniref:Peptidase C14 n=1 Tax=Cylindrobasidium torrendii FP15055 ss-10 TaxID=1314674 RepID=A0A0D7BRK1_9AGAR|nr:peptidase C14 [Cylindrobasidium torrendii FP15055 ss-10]
MYWQEESAVYIGINYVGQRGELKGCVNDARHVHDFLLKYWGFKNRDIMVLTDTNPDKRRHPTKALILGAMKWLVEDAKPHDSLFIHYSGHGGRQRDVDGDEVSGFDETIYPVDYRDAGVIVDDTLHTMLVHPLPMGCRLTALFDCCHSGTVLDLPYSYNTDGSLMKPQVTRKAFRKKMTPADVICWSGSKDGQTSADTWQGGVAVGAMSYAFIKALRKNRCQSYQSLLMAVREILYPKYSQTPQLGSSHHIDTRLEFLI